MRNIKVQVKSFDSVPRTWPKLYRNLVRRREELAIGFNGFWRGMAFSGDQTWRGRACYVLRSSRCWLVVGGWSDVICKWGCTDRTTAAKWASTVAAALLAEPRSITGKKEESWPEMEVRVLVGQAKSISSGMKRKKAQMVFMQKEEKKR